MRSLRRPSGLLKTATKPAESRGPEQSKLDMICYIRHTVYIPLIQRLERGMYVIRGRRERLTTFHVRALPPRVHICAIDYLWGKCRENALIRETGICS
jgi:hypothetical protein